MYLLRYFLKLVHETLYKKTKTKQKKKKTKANTSALSLYLSHFCFLHFLMKCALKPAVGIFIL